MPNVIDMGGNVIREEAVPEVFSGDHGKKLHAVYRAVHREFASARAGTASTKKRDEVSGGGRKPWTQKGTGRARQGSTRSPQWTHGGVVFGPQPRRYTSDLNKKERRAAFVAVLADRFSNGCVTVLDPSGFALRKTAEFAALILGGKRVKNAQKTLVIYGRDEQIGEQMHRVGANIPQIGITHSGALDVKDVLRYSRLVFTTDAYAQLLAATEAK